jgi:tetratricopeptide (TPR) repeat protein
MECLRKERYRESLGLLHQAQELLNESPHSLQLLGITLNNMACYYKHQGQLKVSLTFLEQALAVETSISKCTNLAATLLNICAVCSQLGRHYESLTYAGRALTCIDPADHRTRVLALLNAAAELEHLNRLDEAVEQYTKALKLAQTQLGSKHPITQTVLAKFSQAKVRHKSVQRFKLDRLNKRLESRVRGRTLDDSMFPKLRSLSPMVRI